MVVETSLSLPAISSPNKPEVGVNAPMVAGSPKMATPPKMKSPKFSGRSIEQHISPVVDLPMPVTNLVSACYPSNFESI